MTKKEKNARKQQLKMLAGARGKIREEYFANGGDMAGWRGISSVIPDKKKRKKIDDEEVAKRKKKSKKGEKSEQ